MRCFAIRVPPDKKTYIAPLLTKSRLCRKDVRENRYVPNPFIDKLVDSHNAGIIAKGIKWEISI